MIAGTNGPDTINGTQGNDTILALGGNDTVNGRGGDDVIEGGDGSDTLNGGDGVDRIEGGNGNDRIDGGAGRDFLTGDAGNDIIDGGAGDDSVLSGGDGNDTVSGGGGNDNVDGDDGNDTLFGGTGNDDLFGLDGNDDMFGEGGQRRAVRRRRQRPAERRRGRRRAGRRGRRRPDRGRRRQRPVQLQSPARSSPIPPSPCATWCSTSRARGRPAAMCSGCSGGEFAWVGQINANPRIGAALPGGGDGLTQLGYIQRNGNTFLVADTNDDGLLDANDFTVEFRGLHDFTPDDFDNTDFIIAGTNGDDVITGTEDDDRIFAAGGNDQVFALGGDDEVHGGAGDDFLDGGPGGFDNLFGEEGNDELTLATSDGGGVASGGDGDDVLFGSDPVRLRQQLQGDAGNDDLHAGAVGASMNGGSAARIGCSAARPTTRWKRERRIRIRCWTTRRISSCTPEPDAGARRQLLRRHRFGFQDGSDLFDMRGSGLQFSDLTILNEDFQTTITSDRGRIDFQDFDERVIDEADFLFDDPLLG